MKVVETNIAYYFNNLIVHNGEIMNQPEFINKC